MIINITQTNSSMIKQIVFTKDNLSDKAGLLVAVFANDIAYAYRDVSVEDFSKIVTELGSVGEAFNKNIKNKYPNYKNIGRFSIERY